MTEEAKKRKVKSVEQKTLDQLKMSNKVLLEIKDLLRDIFNEVR